MAEKKKRYTTPIGFAKWAHLNTPKPPYKGDPDKDPKYMIDVCFTVDNLEWRAWAQDLKAQIDALPTQSNRQGETLKKQMPIKKEMGEDDQPTGRFFATFKTGERFKPGVFDKYGKLLLEGILIGNESKVRVSYVMSPYEGFGGGIALYLNAVQVLDLVEYKSQNAEAYGFTVEAEPVSANSAPTPEDELPF